MFRSIGVAVGTAVVLSAATMAQAQANPGDQPLNGASNCGSASVSCSNQPNAGGVPAPGRYRQHQGSNYGNWQGYRNYSDRGQRSGPQGTASAGGWLGVEIQPVNQSLAGALKLPNTNGALVANVEQGSPAESAGMKEGDVIFSVDGTAIDNPRALASLIAGDQPNTSVTVNVWRDGARQDLSVTLGTRPGTAPKAQNQSPQGASNAAVSTLGMTIAPSPGSNGGAVIASVDPNGAAANAGLSAGEEIVSVGDTSVASSDDIVKAVDAAKQNGTKDVLLRVQSRQNFRFVAVPIG